MPVTPRSTCKHCGKPIEYRYLDWIHSDRTGLGRAWCEDDPRRKAEPDDRE